MIKSILYFLGLYRAPKGTYRKINGEEYERIFVVGDIHANFHKLNQELLNIGFNKERDLLISVGNLIDYGSDNITCLELIGQIWFVAVRGNHEEMALDAVEGMNVAYWKSHGGSWYFDLDLEDGKKVDILIRKIQSLPYIIEANVKDGKHVICHADYPSNYYKFGKSVDLWKVSWSRERLFSAMNGNGCKIKGAKQFIFGHSSLTLPFRDGNQIWIDTSSYVGNEINIIQIQ
ncbi:metallophosphoesterase [Rahnella sp. GSA61A]|uniref:metallophosphoesterase n=1 Tax=Rahnella sp. GSA61A TaxID=2862678 RepID=UPI001CBFC3BC|nr:metallophosphoesterase [Rahnella sp. GSA61A]